MTKNSVDWSEFLKNRDGKESSDRLLLLMSFPFATGLTIWIGTTEALVIYLGAYGALAANNKWVDRNASRFMDSEKLEATGDSDTVSASSVTNTVVEKRRTAIAKGKAGTGNSKE